MFSKRLFVFSLILLSIFYVSKLQVAQAQVTIRSYVFVITSSTPFDPSVPRPLPQTASPSISTPSGGGAASHNGAPTGAIVPISFNATNTVHTDQGVKLPSSRIVPNTQLRAPQSYSQAIQDNPAILFVDKRYPSSCHVGIGSTPHENLLLRVEEDAQFFKLQVSAHQRDLLAIYIKYGSSLASCELGEGERRALVRDLFDTLRTTSFPISDLDRLASGQTPRARSHVAASKRAASTRQLLLSTKSYKKEWFHPTHPNWMTVYHRTRSPNKPRLDKLGLIKYIARFRQLPNTPAQWALTRVLGN